MTKSCYWVMVERIPSDLLRTLLLPFSTGFIHSLDFFFFFFKLLEGF